MADKPTILIVGTLDTKLSENIYLRSAILQDGRFETKVLDVSRNAQQLDPEALASLKDEILRPSDEVTNQFAALSRGGRIDLVAHWVGMAVGLGYTSWWKAEHGEVQKREVKPSFVAEVVTGAREKLEGLNTQSQSADTSQVER